MIITLTLSALIIVNFLLLKFSCNKVTKKSSAVSRPTIIKSKSKPSVTSKSLTSVKTKQLASTQLAPTGS